MFRKILGDILSRVEGAQAISLIGLDGIAIESINDGKVPLETLGAEFGSFVKSITLSNTELDSGPVEQFSLVTEKYITFLSSITPEYFLLLVLSRDGNYGRARFELSNAKFALRAELL